MTICKKLTKLLGPKNKLELESEVNIGSTFSFYIYSRMKNKSIDFRNNNSEKFNKFAKSDVDFDISENNNKSDMVSE